MNEQRDERLGQMSPGNLVRSWRDVPVLPTQMKANLDDLEMVVVKSSAGEVPTGRLTDQSRAITLAQFGELFTGCMSNAKCSAKLLKWLRENSGKRVKVFTITVADQGSNTSYINFVFNFEKKTMERVAKPSGLVPNGSLVIVRKGFLPREGIEFLNQ